ncbi:ABC transporter permease [Paenibacillus chungangensis]|uniref:ABC transporter permease n=1 Tax=Paenibacillus chungangensis TaxID=696535 RepID=A0ABW3HVA0_9BACL
MQTGAAVKPNDSRPTSTVEVKRKRGFIFELLKNKVLYLMAIPGILYFFIWHYLPMVGIVIAFKNYNVIDGIFGSEWNGLKNFDFLIKSGDIFRITFNTLFLNMLFIGFGTVFQVGIAILLNEVGKSWFKKLSQSLLLLPYFISWVVVGVFVYYIFATNTGMLNGLLGWFGIDPMPWYQSPEFWPAILTATYIWKWVGYGSVIYLAAIVGIDSTIYEAAKIDGCNKWQLIRYVTIPMLMPTIMVLTLLAIGGIFYGDFGMIFNIVKSNVLIFETTDVIDTYVYRSFQGTGGGMGSIAMGSAAGALQSFLGFVTIITANWLVRRYNRDYALY